MNKNISYQLNPLVEPKIKKELQKQDFSFSCLRYAFWKAENKENNLFITFYKTGKLLIQGKNPERIIDFLIRKKFLSSSETFSPLKISRPWSKNTENKSLKGLKVSKWIGTDESGKGDYFGPLVIAGLMIKKNVQDKLLKIGVRDSKSLSDVANKRLAKIIKEKCLYSLVVINPLKYNELYAKMKNLNNLLAWGHARAIENILEKEICQYAISDKFGNEKYILNALMKKGKNLKLMQRPFAEKDIAVASASILARAEFIKRIEKLSKDYNIKFSKGASDKVIEIAKDFIKKYGKEKLKEIAKIHFKTTKKLFSV